MRHQGQLARLRDCRAIAQYCEVLLLDGIQDFQATAAEEVEIDGELAVDSTHQRKTLPKPVTGALDFEFHHGAESGSVLVLSNFGFVDMEPAQVLQREIYATLGIVHADVLPEIGELQRGAGVVGKALALSIPVSAKVQNQMADGIGRVVAVGEHVIEGLESGDGLILAEGDQQV